MLETDARVFGLVHDSARPSTDTTMRCRLCWYHDRVGCICGGLLSYTMESPYDWHTNPCSVLQSMRRSCIMERALSS